MATEMTVMNASALAQPVNVSSLDVRLSKARLERVSRPAWGLLVRGSSLCGIRGEQRRDEECLVA